MIPAGSVVQGDYRPSATPHVAGTSIKLLQVRSQLSWCEMLMTHIGGVSDYHPSSNQEDTYVDSKGSLTLPCSGT